LKALSGAAGAEIVTAELFNQQLVAMHDAIAAADTRLGGITLASAYA
jgi:hypothetical protein